MRLEVETAASECSMTKWNTRVQPILEQRYTLNYTKRICTPCCSKLGTVAAIADVPVFVWPDVSAGEDAATNVTALAQYLRHMAPQGVDVLPVQRHTWYSARLDITETSTIIITNSRTDYLWVLQEGLAALPPVLTAQAVRDLLPYIVGMYEAKVPSNLTTSSENQGVLEHLAINHLRNPDGGSMFFTASKCTGSQSEDVVDKQHQPLTAIAMGFMLAMPELQLFVMHLIAQIAAVIPAACSATRFPWFESDVFILGAQTTVIHMAGELLDVPVIVGDGIRHICVHEAPADMHAAAAAAAVGAPLQKRKLHISQPNNLTTRAVDRRTMRRIKGLLTAVAEEARRLTAGA
jgi:hypothetical protein